MEFIPAARYEGVRPGYVFKTDSLGLGYYLDEPGGGGQAVGGKRSLDDGRGEPAKKRQHIPSSSDDVLDEPDNLPVGPLDAAGLKAKLLSFERKINKNQEMRMRFPQDPEKFMDSEVDLHDELQELFPIATAPELFPLLVSLGAMKSILGVLTHENTDVSLAAVSLLQELTDPDTLTEDSDESLPLVLIDEFVKQQGIELIVQNLSRLDDSQEEDSLGISHTLSILENIVEAKDSLAEEAGERTDIMSYLLRRLSGQAFDPIKLHCSEVLAILLQRSEANQERLSTIQVDGRSGFEHILQIVFNYRKVVPSSSDEAECIENVFLSLRSALLISKNRELFLENEGFELMMKCLKEGAYAATCSLKTLSFAITSSTASCSRFVEVGGLKFLFPTFMGKSIAKNFSKKKGVKQELEQTAVSILSELSSCLVLNPENESMRSILLRLMSKFSENEQEKLERCMDLYVKYKQEVKDTEQEIALLRRDIEATGDKDALEEFNDDDNLYMKMLNGGLFTLQQICKIIALVCLSEGKKALTTVSNRLSSSGSSFDDFLFILREAAARMPVNSNQVASERIVFITLGAACSKTFSQIES